MSLALEVKKKSIRYNRHSSGCETGTEDATGFRSKESIRCSRHSLGCETGTEDATGFRNKVLDATGIALVVRQELKMPLALEVKKVLDATGIALVVRQKLKMSVPLEVRKVSGMTCNIFHCGIQGLKMVQLLTVRTISERMFNIIGNDTEAEK